MILENLFLYGKSFEKGFIRGKFLGIELTVDFLIDIFFYSNINQTFLWIIIYFIRYIIMSCKFFLLNLRYNILFF